MIDYNKINVDCVSLVGACACNLKCEYCLISQAAQRHKNAWAIQENTIKAFEDGSYLNNVKAALNRLHQETYRVHGLQIWGQEPSLIIKYLTKHLDDWLDTFTGLDTIMFSTNGMEHGEDVAEFAIALDNLTRNPIKFELQVSFDGYFGQDKIRGGSLEKITNNVAKMLTIMNAHNFKNVKIELNTHGVFSVDLAKQITTFEKAEEYISSIDDFIRMQKSIVSNKNIRLGGMSIMGQNGGDFSTEDGLAYVEAIRVIERAHHAMKSDYLDQCPGIRLQVFGAIPKMIVDNIRSVGESADDLLQYSLDNPNATVHDISYCATIAHDLKIMYDGTTLTCQNHLFDTDIDDKIEPKTVEEEAKPFFMERYHKVNFVTDSDYDIQRCLDFHTTIDHNNFTYSMINHTANLMYLMAECGQIDYTYLFDLKKLARHALYLSYFDTCYANMLHASGSVLVKNIGNIRLMANGLLDMLDEAIENALKRKDSRLTWDAFNSYAIDYDSLTKNRFYKDNEDVLDHSVKQIEDNCEPGNNHREDYRHEQR